MSRHQFLGNLDLNIEASLLTNYNAPTKISDGIKFNQIKRQNDLILIELGPLLTSNECDDILNNLRGETFEDMQATYDRTKRNNSRLIVFDVRFARILWRRLKSDSQLTKLISHPQPLGFNVQGQWEMSGVNHAMRLNRYDEGEYFAPHKDGQYAPNADERSFLSLIIYLNDIYEKGETKFYFPKTTPNSDIKGLTINEEIESYGGLENGFECVCIEPKKGHAILFTHNLLHEAVAPELRNEIAKTRRYVLRTDVLVQRKEKRLGFAVSPTEEVDYLACLNFFCEAQQNELREYRSPATLTTTLKTGELYERSLSIRYCYPRLLDSPHIKEEQSNSICQRLPTEVWSNIFKYLDEQDAENFIFAYPQYLPLKILRQTAKRKFFETDPSRSKFIPTIESQYGCQTLFRFSDVQFFDENIHGCCRVAAVYAFFLLAHTEDSTTYVIRYNRNTHEVCEVEKEKLLSDVFYNRNCYGALYKVQQKNENVRNPIVDLDYSVDRTYMTNRHRAQFIGQDMSSRFHFTIKNWSRPDFNYRSYCQSNDYSQYMHEEDLLERQRETALHRNSYKLVYEYVDAEKNTYEEDIRRKDPIRGYRENLMRQTEQESGSSLCRMLSAKDHEISGRCCMHDDCPGERPRERINNLIQVYNHLVFDFDTHQLVVEQRVGSPSSQDNSTVYYRVNVTKLANESKGFDHAGCRSYSPYLTIDQFSFLDYTYLSHVNLTITREKNYVSVQAMYGGIAVL